MSRKEKASMRERHQVYMDKLIERGRTMTPEELQWRHRGILYPSLLCSDENFRAMETLQAREDDVLIVTYPKCGTNWTRQILQELLTAHLGREPTVAPGMLEFEFGNKYEELNHEPSPRVIASHLAYEDLPKTFFERKTKILFILRNPKDTAVSYYHFMNSHPALPTYRSWEDYFENYVTGNVLFGSYFDFTLGWERHVDDGNLLVLTFEDMKVDPSTAMKKICDFYGLSLTEEQIQRVQERTSFASMKANNPAADGEFAKYFYRKGEIGDWKSLFTEEQSRAVDALYEKHLVGTKLGKMINYAKYCTY
ncbi:sulfotransferase 6B1-like [Gastrophryne carolinensis]